MNTAPTRFLYLSKSDVQAVGITMPEIIDVLDRAFHEKGEGRVEMPPKPGIHTQPDAFIHAMPAWIPSLGAAGCKWVSGYPANQDRGLPYINGLLILNDPETGLPLSVMDCTWITAMRTGAATAVAAKYLARPDSQVVGILGCGVQGRSNLEALRVLFPVKRVVAYDVRPESLERFAAEVGARQDVEVVQAQKPVEAVAESDLIVTAGPILHTPHATIKAGWLPKGAFASLVDYDSYWDRAALHEADKFCTDDVPQLELYRSMGYFQSIPPIYAELGEIVAGKKPGRERPDERILACNLGIAMDDMATAIIIYQRALAAGIGTWLPL